MKKILLLAAFFITTAAAYCQEVKDVKHNTIAYITRGKIMDKEQNILYTFKEDGRIVDQQANTQGFLLNNTEMQDKNRKTIGYVRLDGTVEDANHQKIGSILSTVGPVMKNGTVIATVDNVEPFWAACYFFLLKP